MAIPLKPKNVGPKILNTNYINRLAADVGMGISAVLTHVLETSSSKISIEIIST